MPLTDPEKNHKSHRASEVLKNKNNEFRDMFTKVVSDYVFYGVMKRRAGR